MKHWLVIVAIALLSGATVSHADIIYQSANIVVGDVTFPQSEEFYDLDLDSNGTVDFAFVADIVSFAGIHPENQNKYLIHPSPPPNIGGGVAALDEGFIIDPTSGDFASEDWFGNDDWGTLTFILDTGIIGEFYHNRAFIGLEFEADDGVHYGWIDVEGASRTMENHLLKDSSLIIHGWAYESTPGVSIVAGAIPEPTAIGLTLITALAAIVIRRRFL